MKQELLKIYGTDASQIKGIPRDVLFPKTIAEAKEIVRQNSRIVPRGGGTGLAGGCVPTSEDIILDMSKLDHIGEIDETHNTIITEAGVILDDLQKFLEDKEFEFPVKPSSHAVATIGGMIATNAVGNRAIKYGKTSDWIKWIEVIDGNGNTSRKGITEISDYLGLEGITGVISRACLKLSKLKKRTASLVKIDNIEKIAQLVHQLKRNPEVSEIEFIDSGLSEKIGLGTGVTLIIEYEDETGVLSEEEYREVMSKRDSLYPLIAKEGYTRIEDPKVMIDKMEKLISWLKLNKIPAFGHVGVGILHPCFNHDQEKYIPEMMKIVKRLNGQISGEHGIGILKRAFVDVNDKKIIENIKKRTDPQNKFNVGKII